ncbi:MAG: tRNA lysidine(34) synthetase TilS [Hungatella sp.]|jgi:tRNA(Ile)-lysidine synthase|nr:tRNA lysidine(34) synthetase TilS [Hungatella sp.]
MQKKIEAYIREHHMIREGDRVIAAVSGGADSVCLLRLLVVLRERIGFTIEAVHVHHGLRGREADRDAQYVRELSAAWEVPCLVVFRDAAAYGKEQGLSVEEAGRELRYQAFFQEAGAYERARIAVAHHQEDQAETILHNLFRGSGLRGLGGMAPVRDNIIRPLLCVGRQEILDYLRQEKLSYCQDSTNESLDYTRNKLRKNVIPMVCQDVNFKAVEHIVAAGERLRQAEEYFCREAREIWRKEGQLQKNPDRCRIPANVLSQVPEILKGYVVREMIGELERSQKDMGSCHISQILKLADKGTGKCCHLPRGLKAWREYDMICLEKSDGRAQHLEEDRAVLESSLSFEKIPASVLREKYQKIPENKYTKWFDYDKIKGTLSVRTRRTGDYFMIQGGRKTVKAFMIDEKIPKEERNKILLLAEGQHVLWIVGYRISEFYKITDTTKQILQVSMDGGREHEG